MLRETWDRAAAGDPGLVMIIGEAGIGKTALAEALAAQAEQDGATVLRTRCYETEQSLFLQPIVEAIMPVVERTPAARLREMLGAHAPAAAALLPAAAALLGPPPTWRGSLEMERRRAFEAVTALLSPGWPPTARCCFSSTTSSTQASPRSSSSTTCAVMLRAPGCWPW